MNQEVKFVILPYSMVVGQEQLKLALEIAYVAPMVGGVLISGTRGTGKSTVVRAFAQMIYERLPVTLPINATEDRVVGGWDVHHLMRGKSVWRSGLLVAASEGRERLYFTDDSTTPDEEQDNSETNNGQELGGILYIDEVNLLDDHIVNIILDATSTGVLVVQRDSQSYEKDVQFSLVGTMNPEEGDLRPQLLDRFGLVVNTSTSKDSQLRRKILTNVLVFEHARTLVRQGQSADELEEEYKKDKEYSSELVEAKKRFYDVHVSEDMEQCCVDLAIQFDAAGHRADYTIALAAKALAALNGVSEVTKDHIAKVTPLALQHRRSSVAVSGKLTWNDQDDQKVQAILNNANA